jgi:hypothetical protein
VVAAIDEDGEFDLGGAAVIKELVEGGFDGATGEENVVDKNDAGAVDVGGQDGGRKFFRDGIAADVVAVKRDVDGAGFGGEPRAELGETGGEATGERDAAVGDAEKDQAIAGAMAFGDGRGDLVNGGVNIIGADGFGRSHGLIEAARAKPVKPESGASRVIRRSYGTS